MDKKKKIRNRLSRDLTIAAVVIVLVLAYFIPSLIAGAQDLTFAGKQSAYAAETVQFSPENILLSERLTDVHSSSFGENNRLIVLDSGNIYNRDTALEAVGEEWVKFWDGMPEDSVPEKMKERIKSITADPDVQKEAVAAMTVGSTSGEPYILWVCTFSQEEQSPYNSEKENTADDGKVPEEYGAEGVVYDEGTPRQLSIFMDESSGKILGAEYEEWGAAEYYADYFPEQTVFLEDSIGEYFGMQHTGTELLMEVPYAAVITLTAGEDGDVNIPVVIHSSGFFFNTPETTEMMRSYGIPAELTEDEGSENTGF